MQNDTRGFGQSVPFCFSDVPGGNPLLNEKYVSGNHMFGVLGAQIEAYTENFKLGMVDLSGEISFFTIDLVNGKAAFIVHDLETGKEESTELTQGDPFNPLVTYHAWSPDGKIMVGSYAYAVYTKNYETGEIKLLYQPEGEAMFVPDYWAPVMGWVEAEFDKGLVIDCLGIDYVENPPPVYSGVCWFSFTSNEVLGFYNDPEDYYLTQSDVDYLYPSSSLGFTKVAFIRQYYREGEPDGTPQLMVFDPYEMTFTQLNIGGIYPFFPKMSRDGEQILFLGYADRSEENAGVWIIDTNGSNLRQIVAFRGTPESRSFDWSQDGEKIVFSRNSDLWIFNLASGNETQVTFTPDRIEVQPVFRPNH